MKTKFTPRYDIRRPRSAFGSNRLQARHAKEKVEKNIKSSGCGSPAVSALTILLCRSRCVCCLLHRRPMSSHSEGEDTEDKRDNKRHRNGSGEYAGRKVGVSFLVIIGHFFAP